MQDNNSHMFEPNAYFDPNLLTHNPQLLTDHFPNLSAFEPPPADHFHHNHLMHMDIINHQNHQPNNWNHTFHDHIIMENNVNNFLPSQTPPDLLNLLHLPKCSSSFLFSNPSHIFQTGFNIAGCRLVFGETDHENDALFEFDGGMVKGRGKGKKDGKKFVTEKHRREQLNGKFGMLKSLIPNPTKDDRASIVGDAIEYIKKLKRDLEELKISVDRKRCNISRMKRHKIDDDSNVDVESIYTMSNIGNTGHDQQAYNGSSTSAIMKSCWLRRKSKNIEIDVRIIDDEVTIKLVQQKRINCLLLVSKVLDELKLDVNHVAGGLIGDYYSYVFNNKICEGSFVYASAIANKVIEVVDKQYASVPITSSY